MISAKKEKAVVCQEWLTEGWERKANIGFKEDFFEIVTLKLSQSINILLGEHGSRGHCFTTIAQSPRKAYI